MLIMPHFKTPYRRSVLENVNDFAKVLAVVLVTHLARIETKVQPRSCSSSELKSEKRTGLGAQSRVGRIQNRKQDQNWDDGGSSFMRRCKRCNNPSTSTRPKDREPGNSRFESDSRFASTAFITKRSSFQFSTYTTAFPPKRKHSNEFYTYTLHKCITIHEEITCHRRANVRCYTSCIIFREQEL
ncbi:hypothetical protein EVAR_45611_1 [Eumeta japonica]|uniref:Uncharacterized protein n=1 Tax=Eumeta variegata TaxID=151549 RepID=A0A4C1WHF1_EUMVA|nr:hypothetical protein EVAR_45611_1 [Eumeta japonica]